MNRFVPRVAVSAYHERQACQCMSEARGGSVRRAARRGGTL